MLEKEAKTELMREEEGLQCFYRTIEHVYHHFLPRKPPPTKKITGHFFLAKSSKNKEKMKKMKKMDFAFDASESLSSWDRCH